MKSLCQVKTCLNYYDAERFCFDNGMDLMIFETEAVTEAVFKDIVDIHGGPEVWDHSWGLWINGRLNNHQWHVTRNFQKHEMTNGIKPVNESQLGGDCAQMKRNRNSLEKRNYDCKRPYFFLCEYHSVM